MRNNGPLMAPYGNAASGGYSTPHMSRHIDQATRRPYGLPPYSAAQITANERMEDSKALLLASGVPAHKVDYVESAIANRFAEAIDVSLAKIGKVLEEKSSDLLVGPNQVIKDIEAHIKFKTTRDTKTILTNDTAGDDPYASLKKYLTDLKNAKLLVNNRTLGTLTAVNSEIDKIIKLCNNSAHPGDKVLTDISEYYKPKGTFQKGLQFISKAIYETIGLRTPLSWRSLETITKLSLATHFPKEAASPGSNLKNTYEKLIPQSFPKIFDQLGPRLGQVAIFGLITVGWGASLLATPVGTGVLTVIAGLYAWEAYEKYKSRFPRE